MNKLAITMKQHSKIYTQKNKKLQLSTDTTEKRNVF